MTRATKLMFRRLIAPAPFVWVACVLQTLSLAGGCRAPQRMPASRLGSVSDAGSRDYSKAMQLHEQMLTQGVRGAERNARLHEVARLLKAAQDNDPDCPLFHSKLGDVLLESGATDEAYQEFSTSVSLCNDWVPGRLGLARWAGQLGAIDQDKYEEAASELERAEASLRRIRAGAKSITNSFGAEGTGSPSESGNGNTDGLMPELPQQQRLLGLLARDESPTFPNFAVSLDRLQARIWYQRAVLSAAQGEPADHVLKLVDESLRFDKNYAPTRIQQASQLRQLGSFQVAESVLRPVADNPRYHRDLELQFELARLYAAWCINAYSDELSDMAEEAFKQVHDLDGEFLEGWLARAEFRYAIGARRNDAEFLRGALICVDNALKTDPANGSASELRVQITKELGRLENRPQP